MHNFGRFRDTCLQGFRASSHASQHVSTLLKQGNQTTANITAATRHKNLRDLRHVFVLFEMFVAASSLCFVDA
jgi:hypothetical protein